MEVAGVMVFGVVVVVVVVEFDVEDVASFIPRQRLKHGEIVVSRSSSLVTVSSLSCFSIKI